MLEFLQSILPHRGPYCAAIHAERGFKHVWCDTVEQLAHVIAQCDARGLTVYHGCAAYVSKGTLWKGRRQSNVRALKALWADIDCGGGKPYATALDGALSVIKFCTWAGLPVPLFVNSGYGVHVYWPLAIALDPASWRILAVGLRELCDRFGLHVDKTRAVDSASILRTPGTHNRKHGQIRNVVSNALVGPFDVKLFRSCWDAANTIKQSATTPRVGTRNEGSVEDDILSSGAPDAHLIAEQCEQFRIFVERKGDSLAEPHWRAGCGIAHWTRQGDEFAHAHSTGDPRYRSPETQYKIDSWTAPPTCAYFNDSNPGVCQHCPHVGKIHSPIGLGYSRKPSVHAPASTPVQPDRRNERGSTEGTQDRSRRLVDLPQHYDWGPNGELVLVSSKDGRRIDHIVSRHPIYLDSVQVGEASKEFKLVFQQHLPHEGWKEILIPAAVLQTSEAFAALSKWGANVSNKQLFLEYSRSAIDLWHQKNRLRMNFEQYGWKNDFKAFLFGETLYTAAGKEHISGNQELRLRSQYVGPSRSYSLLDWQQRANALFTQGAEAQAVALCAGVGSPLMALISNEGGVILALINIDSGTGKSVGLTGATSVWGRKRGLEIRKETSTISRGLILASLGNLPVQFDEMRARDPKTLKDWIKQVTEGGDKARAGRDGTLKHVATEWQTFVLTADNRSLVDIVSENDDVDDPCAMRIIEIPCTLPKDLKHIFGDRLKDELDAMSGWAGDVFLQWLIQPANLEWTRKLLRDTYDSLYKDTGWQEKHRFWVRGIACIIVAGLIMKMLGIIDFDVPRIARWLIDQCAARVTSEKKENLNIVAAMNAFTRFLDEKVGERIVVDGPFQPHKRAFVNIRPTAGKLSIRYETSTHHYIVSVHAWRSWCNELGLPWRSYMDIMCNAQVIINRSRRITIGAGTDYEGGQVWAFVVNGHHSLMADVTPGENPNVIQFPQRSSSDVPSPPPQGSVVVPPSDQTA